LKGGGGGVCKGESWGIASKKEEKKTKRGRGELKRGKQKLGGLGTIGNTVDPQKLTKKGCSTGGAGGSDQSKPP